MTRGSVGANRRRISDRFARTYWRACRAVARASGRGVVLAALVSSLIALFGMLVLVLDVTGAAG